MLFSHLTVISHVTEIPTLDMAPGQREISWGDALSSCTISGHESWKLLTASALPFALCFRGTGHAAEGSGGSRGNAVED